MEVNIYGLWVLSLLLGYMSAFITTMLITPRINRRLKRLDYVAVDMYKRNYPAVPKGGGIITMIFTIGAVAILPTLIYAAYKFWRINADFLFVNQAAALIVMLYGLFGLLDDIIDVGRPAKVIFPLAFGLPITFMVNPDVVNLILWQIDLSQRFPVDGLEFTYRFWFKLIVIPIYIMVTANLVNMHSGFNGLALGTTTLVASALLIKGVFLGYAEEMLSMAVLVGTITALTYFNRYPAELFEGNVGALMNGSLIGVLIVITSSYTAGFVMLIPHTINFLMYVYWRVQHVRYPTNKLYDKHLKFGKVRDDGTLEVPNPLTLKWLLPYHYRMTEEQVVKYMWALTAVFCIIGFFVPY